MTKTLLERFSKRITKNESRRVYGWKKIKKKMWKTICKLGMSQLDW